MPDHKKKKKSNTHKTEKNTSTSSMQNAGQAILKFLGTAGAFLLAVILVAADKIKALYQKLPSKMRIFDRSAPDANIRTRTNTAKKVKTRKGLFSGFSEKQFARIWAVCGVACVVIFAAVIVVFSLSKPKPAAPVVNSEAAVQKNNTATLTFSGSIMMQDSILSACKTDVGDYEIYDGLKYLGQCFNADMNIASLLGAVNETACPVSGLPKANYPINLARAMSSVHINGIALASDHSFDAGTAGIASTIDAFQAQSVAPFGIYRNAEEYESAQIFELNGVKIGFINESGVFDDDYLSLSDEQKANNYIRHFNQTDPERAAEGILKDAEMLTNSGANLIVAMLRWGDSDTTMPSEKTRDLADRLVRGGVDIILGYGSNYTQKVTYKEFEQTDGTKKNCLVMYDLGNLYSDNSSLTSKYVVPTESLLMTVKVALPSDSSKAVIIDVGYTPLHISKSENAEKTRAKFITLPSGKYGSADELPEMFASNQEWEACKTSFDRMQKRMTEWVSNKIHLNALTEESNEPVSAAQNQV